MFEKDYPFLPEKECKVGFFASIMLKNNKFYIIRYLNKLIHGLLTAMK